MRERARARARGNIRFYFRNLWLSINFKSVPSGALRAGKAGQTESSRRERARFSLSLFRHLFLSFFLSVHLASFFLLRFSSFLLSYFLIYSSFIYPLPTTSFPSSSSLPIYAIPGSYGDSGLAVNCVWCNPRGFYNRDFHPFFLPPGLWTGRPSTPFSPLHRLTPLPPLLLPQNTAPLYPPSTPSLPLPPPCSLLPFCSFRDV